MQCTKNQTKELVVWNYFMFPTMKDIPIQKKDLKMFFEWSERGLHKEKLRFARVTNGFQALVQGKRWAGIHMHEMYEEGILDGSMPYYVILGGLQGDKYPPREVVDFMKKELFKGEDAELIEYTYQQILKEKLDQLKK